jgi:hypothetical protein
MMRATRHETTIVDRYTPGARINHWITAGSLILLALSGLAFFHPSLFFLTGLFGGGVSARMIHPWIGVVLLISFTGLFIRFVRFNFWNRDDTLWTRRMGDVINARDDRLPELGKYEQDFAEAANWYRRAAEQGDAEAQNALSRLLLEAEYLPPDYAEARRWAEAAAAQGIAIAEVRLGMIYHNALGVARDPARAAYWWQRAA